MDLFGRYIFRQLVGSFLLILVTLTTIIWLSSALAKLSLLTTKGQSVFMLLKITSLALPALMAIIAPMALLVACLYTLDRLNGDSEIIVMSASGARIWKFASPCIILASILCVVILFFNLIVTPTSLRTLRSFITQVQTDLVSQVLQPGRFTAAEDELTFHIRDRSLNGELYGLIVHDSRSKDLAMTYLANRGQIVSNDDGSYLVMKDGHIHRKELSKKDNEVQIVAFEQYIFDISQYGPKSTGSSLKRGELYLSELMNPDVTNRDYIRNPGRYTAEIHERFSSALYPLAYIMIVINFLGHPRTVRENRMWSIVIAFVVAISLRAAGLATNNMLATQSAFTTLVYAIPIGAIIVAGIMANVKMAPYALPRISLDALAKFQILNNKFMAALGVKTEQNGGQVG
jgi:lipopolysaccharide export system permease protein